MVTTTLIGARVDCEMKSAFRATALEQGLSESALLKQLIGVMLCRGVRADAGGQKCAARALCRSKRLSVRLRADDLALLTERARAHTMRPATYVSCTMRSHLRRLTPLPKKELATLVQAVAELSAMGRNLNQIARALNQGARADGPSRDDLRAILKACTGLRDHVRSLLEANLSAWEAGHDQASR